MKWWIALGLLAACTLDIPSTLAQTQKPLTNSDIVAMTKQGFEPSLIIKDIESSSTSFDVSPQALIDLKNAGVPQSVIEAMLSAHAKKPSAGTEAEQVPCGTEPAHGAMLSPEVAATDPSKHGCDPNSGCLLRDGTQVSLKFAADLSSKTAQVGDPVEFLLDDDLKVGETVVVTKGAHAVATVSAAKHAGMMGKPGDLAVQLQYLVAGDNHVRLRGTKGREGESKTGATVALTVLFGPIGLIKHGKDVQIKAGTPLTVYVDQDIWLPLMK